MISRLLLLVFVVAAAACDKVPLTAPTNSTITISAASRSVGLGGSTEVSAFVAENSGTPVQNGTSVRFTTNLGRVDPVEAQTRNGVAVTTFFAGDTSGTAQIRATSGGTTGATANANTVDVAVGAVAATTVIMSAQPNTLPVGGGTSTIVASVLDAAGNRLRGVPVSFSTDVGTLSSSSAVTDSNGDATVQLTTSRQAVVTARAGGATGVVNASVTVRVVTANAVVLTVPTTAVQVGQAVTVTVAPPADANATVPNVTISWGDGTVDNLGALPASRTVSHIYNSAGTFQIIATATADGVSVSTSAAVTVNPKPAVGVTVAATTTAPYTVNVTPVTFTATVSGTDASTVVTSYRWQFLDATGAVEFETTTSGNLITRVFTSIGLKTVNVTVTFSDGRTATAQTQIVVVN